MEGALIAFALKAGADPSAARRGFPRLAQIPFDARHRYMATLNHSGITKLLIVKAHRNVFLNCAPARGRLARTSRSTQMRGAEGSTRRSRGAVPRHLFVDILRLIAELRQPPVTSTA
jgi:magnesium-transporting ATPase (P-type)